MTPLEGLEIPEVTNTLGNRLVLRNVEQIDFFLQLKPARVFIWSLRESQKCVTFTTW